MPSDRRCSGGIEACVIIAGCSIRLSTPPRLSANAKHAATLQHSPRVGEVAFQNHGHHTAECAHLPRCNLVPRMVRQSRIKHALHLRMIVKPLRQLSARSRNAVPCGGAASLIHAKPEKSRTDRRSPPTAFCRNPSRSPNSASAATATPPTRSEWPPMYFVAECMTIPKPNSIGRCKAGLANVLSATAITPCSRAICPTAARSMIFNSGFDGVSTHSMRVFGRMASRTASAFDMSTKLKSRPAERRRTRSNKRNVPPYRSSLAKTWSPESSKSKRRRHRRQARGESESPYAALQIRHAAFVGESGRVVRSRVLKALCGRQGSPAHRWKSRRWAS